MPKHAILIKGFENYYVSFERGNFGIYSVSTHERLRPLNAYGEEKYRLYKNGVPADVSLLRILTLITYQLNDSSTTPQLTPASPL